jgi:hypothetical protein
VIINTFFDPWNQGPDVLRPILSVVSSVTSLRRWRWELLVSPMLLLLLLLLLVAEVEKRHTVDSGRRLEEVEAEAHHHSTLEMAVVDFRTVVEIHILQVGKVEADTTAVSSGEVEIQAPVGTGSAVVVAVALGVDTGYAEAEVAGENISFVAVENMRSAGVVVGWKSKTASWGYCQTSLVQHRDRGPVSVEVVEVADCIVVKVGVDVEPVEMVLSRTGLVFAQGLTSCIDFEKAAVVVEAETWL